MARWLPDARRRLVGAALELFGEQGYDRTTVAEIAERAGLTKSTFFRHFPDKREVLFAGQDMLCELLTSGIAGAPASSTPLEAVGAALDSASAFFTEEQRTYGPRLQAVIASNSELRERDAMKSAGFATAMTDALHARGVPDPTATVAAELGVLAFKRAFARWTDPASEPDLPAIARQELDILRTVTATLG